MRSVQINAMSDLETDAAAKELNAAKSSPWPEGDFVVCLQATPVKPETQLDFS